MNLHDSRTVTEWRQRQNHALRIRNRYQDTNTHLFLDIRTLSYVKAGSHRALPPGDQYSNGPAVACLSLDLVSTRQRLKQSDSVVCLSSAHHSGTAQILGKAFEERTPRAQTDGCVLSTYSVWVAADCGGPFDVGKHGHRAQRRRQPGTFRTRRHKQIYLQLMYVCCTIAFTFH